MPHEDLAGQRIGRISIERFLARGGMGAVYAAFDETLELGRLRARQGEAKAARSLWEEALGALAPLAEDAGAVSLQNTRAKALLLLDRVDEARPIVSALLAKGWSDPDLLALCRAGSLPCRPGA